MRTRYNEMMIALGLLLFVCGTADAQFPGGAESVGKGALEGKRVVVVGDSLALGLGEALRTWNATTSVHAVEGATSRYWRWRIDERMAVELARGKADIVLVVLGTNDLKPPVDNAKTAEFLLNVRRIQETLARVGTRVVWIVPRWVPWSAVIETWLENAGVENVSVPGGPAAVDRVHLSRAGYLEWSHTVDRWL